MFLNSRKGQTILELLIIMAIAGLLLPVLYSAFISSRDGEVQGNQRYRATELLKETVEAVRTVRETGWININTNGTYFPQISGSTYILSSTSPPGELTPDGFRRLITISDVQRDLTGMIVSTGGNVDPSTKKFDINISWDTPNATSLTSTLYLTRYLENASYTETTVTQFNNGLANSGTTGVTIRATNPPAVADDGEIILGAGGNGNWCAPNLLTSYVDLSGSAIADSVTASEGQALAATGGNASGVPLIRIGVNNADPPVANETGTSTLSYKANSVYGDGNYAYMATDDNSEEIIAVNVSGSSPYNTIATTFNSPGSTNGDAVFITSNYGYMTAGNKFYNFNKVGSNLSLDADGVTLDGVGNEIYVVDNYAYIATQSTTYQLNIIDLSNPSNLQLRGRIGVQGQAGKDVFVSSDGNFAYLVTAQSSTQNEFFVINTVSKTNPTLVTNNSTFNTSPMDPRGVVVVPGNYAVIVGHGGDEYQVLNVGNVENVFRCGLLNNTFNINDIAAIREDDGDVYSYIVTSEANAEFRVIEGGPGGSYSTAGIFESQTHNPGYTTANNRFQANFVEPLGTTIRFQVSMANLVAGTCPASGYTFVGPNGSTTDWFEPASGESVAFPYTNVGTYSNPGQCLRYKVDMSTSSDTSSPVLEDITINFSP